MNKHAISQYISDNYQNTSSKLTGPLLSLIEEKHDLTIADIKPLTSTLFKVEEATKGMCRAVFRVLSFDTPDLNACHFVYIASRACKGVSPDHLVQYLNRQKSPLLEASIQHQAVTISALKQVDSIFGYSRVLKMLWLSGDDLGLLTDSLKMTTRIKETDHELYFIRNKKTKTLRQWHDMAQRTSSRIDAGDFSLEQREDILALDNAKIDGDMVIRVPETHFDLVTLGDSLDFCIGNGNYSREVKEKKCSIIAVFDKNKPLYGIQFTRYKIKEAHGFSNRRENKPSKDILRQLEALILKRPDCPDDFLPITDSGFIHGYKYDNKNLYLQLNDSIYIYFDVPHDVYEELLDSDRKGAFLNSTIKRNYECEFLKKV